MKISKIGQALVGLTVIAIMAAVPGFLGPYWIGVALNLLMWVALTQSWCIFSRLAGYVSLGYVVFYGIGAYVVVLTWQAWPLWLAVPAGGLLAAAFAAFIGLPALRVRGPYFVILTFGLAELVKFTIMAAEASAGISSRVLFGAPDLSIIYYGMGVVAVISTAMMGWVSNSRFGHGLKSLRENEEAAATLGVPVLRYKLTAFVLSAAIPGLVGALMAMRSSYFAVPQVFDPMISVTVIAMALLGGGDNARGPLLGAVFLTVLSEVLWVQAPTVYLLLLGFILVVFVLRVPNGLYGWLQEISHRRSAA